MLGWQELSQQLQQLINTAVSFIKARKREEASIGLAAILFWLGYYLPSWLTPELKDWVSSWHGLLIIPGGFYAIALGFLCYGLYRIWQLVHTPNLPPPKDRPSAIKGPIAFTPADGELFRRLGREDELRKLLGFIEDDQVRLVVLMGASGAGKTSLLRAGLTNILKNKDVDYHYWEAVPTSPEQSLLRAIQQSWRAECAHGDEDAGDAESFVRPESLEDVVNFSSKFRGRKHVIVLDQFEQLHGSSANNAIFRLLRKVAREAKPPHSVTWIIAFRREFRAEWEDFTMPEKERHIYPAEISLSLFTVEQAKHVVSQLVDDAQLSIQQRVVENLITAATFDGEVSPVDIGIGLLVLAELHDRQGGQTVTLRDYQFAGGAEGLLTQYVSRCLSIFPEADKESIVQAMLALHEYGTNQRIAEGRTLSELAKETGTRHRRLGTQLERLAQRDMRLLETVAAEDHVIRYRLTQERLIPALYRMAEDWRGGVGEAKLKLENAYTTWKNSGGRTKYLLKAGNLRLVERYTTQMPWGNDASGKRAFLRRSQRWRALRRLSFIGTVFLLIASIWLGSAQYQRYYAQTYLSSNGYPSKLYDWQQQTKQLALLQPINTQYFSWLKTNTLEELTITVPAGTSSLDSLTASLEQCNSLKKLTLDLSNSKVHNLGPLTALKKITYLALDLSDSAVTDLKPLESLTNLTELNLELKDSKVSDLGPLASLIGLTRLSLDVSSASNKVRDLSPLARLTGLTQLSLNLHETSIGDLSSIGALTNLQQMSLDLSDGFAGERKLDSLANLSKLTQLSLNLSAGTTDLGDVLNAIKRGEQPSGPIYDSGVSDLRPLASLTNLTELNLAPGNGVNDLGQIRKLTKLTQLSLTLGGSAVDNLKPLTSLTNLSKLTLYLDGSVVRDISPLVNLASLTELDLTPGSDGSDQLVNQLGKLTRLTHLTLDLRETGEVNSLTVLAGLTNLTQLKLALGSNKISDLRWLSNLTGLHSLYLELNDSEVDNLDSLARLINLTELTLIFSASKVNDLEPLKHLNGLNALLLNLGGSKVNDLSPIADLTNLNHLDISLFDTDTSDSSDVRELRPLSGLTKLTELNLDLENSKVSDLRPLTSLLGLNKVSIDLRGSGVTEVTPLATIFSCRELILVADTDQIMSLKAISPNITHLEF